MIPKRFAVIDIGTLKIKFQILETDAFGEPRILQQSNTLTRLGVRMEENGNQPWPEYLQATFDELRRCKSEIQRENVDRFRVVSTHALREMGAVGRAIAEQIETETGLPVEIISQEEEARLFHQAVWRDLKAPGPFALVDVGGGSVQVLIADSGGVTDSFLLKCGSQLLMDRFSPRHTEHDFPTSDETRAMEGYILEQLAPFPKNLGTPVIYGSSVILDLFKALGLKMDPFGFSNSHPFQAAPSELEAFLAKIASMPYGERDQQFPFSQKHYMWGVDKAFLFVSRLCQKLNAPYVVPSNANINQGLLLSMMG